MFKVFQRVEPGGLAGGWHHQITLWVSASAVAATCIGIQAQSLEDEAARPLRSEWYDGRTANQSVDCARNVCEITLAKVATLADKGPAGFLQSSAPPNVVQDRRGRFFAPAANRRQVAVFDRAGRFLSLLDTPDPSARAVILLAGPRGSVLAWSFPAGRAFAVADDLKFTSWPTAVPYLPSFLREDDSTVVAQQIQTPELMGYPLHLVGPDGLVNRSFGTETPEYRADLRLLLQRVAAPASDGAVWASAPGRYTIERWNPSTGARLSRVRIRSSWFVESSNHPRDNLTRPKPIILALWERDGLVWVLIQDADAAWKPSTNAERLLDPNLRNSKYDSVLEVIDPISGTVLASKRFPFVVFGRPPQPFVASYASTQAGQPIGLDVWKPELRRKGMRQ